MKHIRFFILTFLIFVNSTENGIYSFIRVVRYLELPALSRGLGCFEAKRAHMVSVDVTLFFLYLPPKAIRVVIC